MCNTSTGAVTHSRAASDDGNTCTIDVCNSVTGAVTHALVATDDGSACTVDACDAATGNITHAPVAIDDSNACTADACDATTGTITHAPVAIDDSSACTVDACNATTGAITHTAVNLDDGNACTADACDAATGVSHVAVNVSDGNACTTDSCNTGTGGITHVATCSLTASSATPAASTNLTTGMVDWAAWGYTTSAAWNHKSGTPTVSIGNYTALGNPTLGSAILAAGGGFTWTSGTPTATVSTAEKYGEYATGQTGVGFQLNVPASATSRTLKLFLAVAGNGSVNTTGTLALNMDDGGASYTATTAGVKSTSGTSFVSTITYKSATGTSGVNLVANWTLAGGTAGKVYLKAAQLQQGRSVRASLARRAEDDFARRGGTFSSSSALGATRFIRSCAPRTRGRA